MNPEQEECARRFREHLARFDRLMSLIGDKQRLNPAEVQTARELYTELKASLKADFKAGDTGRGQASLNQTERQYFNPAITEAYCRLHSSTNSHPLKSNWLSELYSARFDIGHMLSQLEKQ